MAKIKVCALGFTVLMLSACGPDDSGPVQMFQAATADAPDVHPFSMGARDERVGEIRVWNDEYSLYVQYVMDVPYELADAHVCVSLTPLVWTPPGQCPYKQDPMPPDTTVWMFTIPLADLGEPLACDTPLYLQVHGSILDALTDSGVGSAYAGTFKGQIAYSYTCTPPDVGGCTRTQGYWKTHPSAWPVSGLTIGGVEYTKQQLIGFLKTPPRGDASVILGHQLVAALLNEASGAGLLPEVSGTVAAAQAWMETNRDSDGRLPYGIRPAPDGYPNPSAWDEAIGLAALLDLFNNGEFGLSHCE